MKRLGKQLKKFVDPYTKASDPDGDLEVLASCVWSWSFHASALLKHASEGQLHQPPSPVLIGHLISLSSSIREEGAI